MKKLFVLFGLPFFLFANLKNSEEALPFVVGTTSGYAPYVSLNLQGDYEGFDIDVAKEIAKKLKRRLVIKDFGSMPGLMLGLKQGKADALIWAISITEERKKAMDMIYYQGEKESELTLVFWKKIPEGIRSFADLAEGLALSVEAGSFQESVLKKYPTINLKNLSLISDAILALKYGKVAAASIDHSLFATLKKQYPELEKLNVPLALEDCSQGMGVCISRSRPELTAQVEKAVAELRAEGTMGNLEKKWGLAP